MRDKECLRAEALINAVLLRHGWSCSTFFGPDFLLCQKGASPNASLLRKADAPLEFSKTWIGMEAIQT